MNEGVNDDEDFPDVKVRITMWTNMIGSNVERVYEIGVPTNEWDEMSEDDQENMVLETFLDYAMDQLGGWTWEIAPS